MKRRVWKSYTRQKENKSQNRRAFLQQGPRRAPSLTLCTNDRGRSSALCETSPPISQLGRRLQQRIPEVQRTHPAARPHTVLVHLLGPAPLTPSGCLCCAPPLLLSLHRWPNSEGLLEGNGKAATRGGPEGGGTKRVTSLVASHCCLVTCVTSALPREITSVWPEIQRLPVCNLLPGTNDLCKYTIQTGAAAITTGTLAFPYGVG